MKKVPLNVRIDADLRERLIELAKQDNRPLSNLVETLLKQYVAEKAKPTNRRG
jgi:predicted transcriptional regulator